LDFLSESTRLTPALQSKVRPVVAKHFLSAHHWQDIPDELLPEDLPEDSWPSVIKVLNKVWPFKAPGWVTALRHKAAALRQERQPVAGSPAAAEAPERAAPALDAANTPVASEAADESASEMPEAVATTAKVPGTSPTYVVGDIVKLGSKVAKAVQGAEAQVVKESLKILTVKFLSGTQQGKTKQVRPDALTLLQPSSLRTSLARGRVPESAAGVSVPPGASASSSSAAAAPGADVAVADRLEQEKVEAARLAEELFDFANEDGQ
jgi:hypothetical protein